MKEQDGPPLVARGLAVSQKAIVDTYTAIALAYCAASSWFYYTAWGNTFEGHVHAFSFAVIAANYLVLQGTKDYTLATHVILFIGTLVVGSQFATGGWAGTGAFWTYAYLPYAFFLASTALAALWVAVLLAFDGIFVVLHLTGRIALPYGGAELAIFGATLGIFLLCMFLFKAATLRSERGAEQKAKQLAEANAELKVAKEAAEASAVAKSQFLATMSHEIRTPMNGVIGLADLLRAGTLDPDQQEIVHTIHLSGEHLLTVINDILDFSKIDAGKVELESIPVDVRGLVTGCMAIVAPRAAEKGLELQAELDPDLPAAVLGDPGRLRQVLLNLLSNAIKFTAAGSVTVRVNAPILSDGRDGLAVEVADTGIGIPVERQSALFQSFTQGDASTTRQYGGTGLGLAISARLVQLMGGRIAVDSLVGQGSTFRFTVPAVPASAKAAATGVEVAGMTAAQITAGASRLSILIAEDNVVNQRVLQRMLAHYGCTAQAVANGALAIEAAFRGKVDLLFMDLQMPVMDGLEATRRLRARPPAHVPTIVALTADAMPGDRERCMEAGADDYVAKPLRLEALAAVLARTLAARAKRQP